jgi:hypothetical protein
MESFEMPFGDMVRAFWTGSMMIEQGEVHRLLMEANQIYLNRMKQRT